MKSYKIYTLCCSKTKEIRYVGVTVRTLKQRYYQHIWNAKNKLITPYAKWIHSLNGDIEIELLDESDDNNWQLTEKYWISQFKSWGFRLLNLEEGGIGVIRGRRLKSENSKKKPVLKFSMDGKFIERYDSVSSAIKAHGLRSVSSLTNHLIDSHGLHVAGFRWCYEGSLPKPYRRVKVRIGDNEFIYQDMMAASKAHHFCRTKAREFLEGKRGPIRGLQIEYDIV